MPKKISTIYDLAALAEVSASTVSAVMSGTWRERRIAEATALKVQRLADKHIYSINRQASGLRKSKSGLTGMIIPQHDNMFFSLMAQAFERFARERQWHPLVVSTLRAPELELETVRALITYRIEHLVITGATDPDSVGKVCRQFGVAHVNVDLPGHMAASVISDNFWGAQQLTRELIQRSRRQRSALRNRAYFLGGLATDHATQRRIEGFTDILRAFPGEYGDGQIDACGYDADLVEAAVRKLYARIGGLPKALFINSLGALEGVARFVRTLPREELDGCVFGCYDWEPFARMLHFPVVMVRQNVEALMAEAFRIFDEGTHARKAVVEIKPELVLP